MCLARMFVVGFSIFVLASCYTITSSVRSVPSWMGGIFKKQPVGACLTTTTELYLFHPKILRTEQNSNLKYIAFNNIPQKGPWYKTNVYFAMFLSFSERGLPEKTLPTGTPLIYNGYKKHNEEDLLSNRTVYFISAMMTDGAALMIPYGYADKKHSNYARDVADLLVPAEGAVCIKK